MHEFTKADLIWNRACEGSTVTLSPGDRALEAMLGFHGAAMNGGVLYQSPEILTLGLRRGFPRVVVL